jgi:PhnB protein
MKTYIRHGIGAVRAYVNGKADLPAFLQTVFNARGLERHAFGPDQHHVELAIGDSVIVVEAGTLPDDVTPWTSSIYLYVEDVDACYERALQAGAISISKPEDKPYNERQAGFRDAAGNTWWVATYTE